MVPENFNLPNLSVKKMFFLWYLRNAELNIRPYRFPDNFKDDLKVSDRSLFSKIKKIMNEIDEIGNENNFFFGGLW